MEANRTYVRRLWDAFEADGVDAMLALAGEHVVWVPASAQGRELRSPPALRAHLAALAADGHRERAELDELVCVGPHVLALGRVHRSWPDGRSEVVELAWLYVFERLSLRRALAFSTVAEAQAAAEALAGADDGRAPDELDLRVTPTDGGPTVVAVEGELDLATAPQLVAAVGAVRGPVELDLTGVGFMDSSGLTAVIRLCRGEDVRVGPVSAAVARTIALAGASPWLG